MRLETMDLFVTQQKTANHLVRAEKLRSKSTQAGVRRKRFIFSYPRTDRAFGNVDMQALADPALRIAYGVAEVIGRDRFEDNARRIRLIFSCGCSEFVQALPALEDLQISKVVQSPAFFDGGL